MLTFDKEKHEYKVGDRVVPSVTQILSSVFGRSFYADEWYLDRGKAVHACAAMIVKKQEFDHDPQIAGQVAACRQWFKYCEPIIEFVEEPYFDQTLMFAGTPDIICRLRGIPYRVIVDWKASPSKIDPVQLAGYGILAKAKKGMIVQLKEDGTYRMEEYTLLSYERVFKAALTVFNTKKAMGIKDKEE